MRPSWINWVWALNPMASTLGRLGKDCRQNRRTRGHSHMKMEAEAGAVKDCQQLPEAGGDPWNMKILPVF